VGAEQPPNSRRLRNTLKGHDLKSRTHGILADFQEAGLATADTDADGIRRWCLTPAGTQLARQMAMIPKEGRGRIAVSSGGGGAAREGELTECSPYRSNTAIRNTATLVRLVLGTPEPGDRAGNRQSGGPGSARRRPISGASMKPARSLDTVIAAREFTDLWIYLSALLAGAAAAAVPGSPLRSS
jgi:hypothetical protein